MKSFVILSLIKLLLSHSTLTLSRQYESANALKRDDVKRPPVYSRSFLEDGQWINRLKHWTKDSTDGKIASPAEWLKMDIKKMENDKVGVGKLGNYFNSDVGRLKEVASSMKSDLYNMKNQEKINKDSKRVRKDVQTKSQNMTEQSVQCEVASLSCRNCCENSNICSHKTSFCRCDPQCNFYDDCCVDYETFCGKKQHISFRVSKQGLSCMKPKHVNMRSSDSSVIWVINKCPRNRKSDEITRNCEIADDLELNVSSLRNLVPVVGKNNLTFRNEFCAKCNGIVQFEYFGFNMTCHVVPPASITSFNELAEFASKYCETRKWITIFREDNQPVRECNQYFRHLCPTLRELNEKCKRHYLSAGDCISVTLWCNLNMSKWDETAFEKCVEEPSDDLHFAQTERKYMDILPPFSVVLRFPKGHRVSQVQKTRCAAFGQFYDRYLETCRSGQSIPPVKENLDKYYVAIWFDVSKVPDSLPGLYETISSLAQLFNFQRSQASELKIVAIEHLNATVVLFKLELTSEQTLLLAKFNYTGMNNALSHFENNSGSLANGLPLRRLLFFSGNFNITISNETFDVFKTTFRQLACIRKQTYPQGTYKSTQNGEYYYIDSTGKTFAKKQVFFEGNINTSISVCEQIVFSTCVGRRVNLTSEEYVKFDNLSIFYNRTKTIYDFGEYDIEDGKIIMCIPADLPTQFPLKQSNSSVIQVYLTLTCFVLSLACLLLVIQTYIIFPELRNLPGKNLLSLAVSLFLAQLLWLIPHRWYTSTVCHVAAIVEHYLFLVSFVAMGTIAQDTHAVFACQGVRKDAHKKEENKKFYKYSAVVWGLPAMFVAVCALADQLDIYAVYVNEQSCWFDNMQAQEYLFVLPVGLLLLFNAAFFVLTVIRIQRVRSTTRLIRSNQRRRTMFWVYLKLSALMGFSWLFGFIDLFAESTAVFSYLFVIFASLQGVYIALAFVMKKEVWEKYKKLLERKQKNFKFKPDYRSTLLENLRNSRETRV